MSKRVLVTGAAGFIGFHLCRELVRLGYEVRGVDRMRSSYPREWQRKRARKLADLGVDMRDGDLCEAILGDFDAYSTVYHLAALPGVRGSVLAPVYYTRNNVVSTAKVFEAAAESTRKPRVVYASSSSAKRIHSVYGATKLACEQIADGFCATTPGLDLVGLRPHTVYGSWGRPDMAIWKWTEATLAGLPIQVYGEGAMHRDFTHVSDIVRAFVAAGTQPVPEGHSVYDVGSGSGREIMDAVDLIFQACGRTTSIEFLKMQTGDVRGTLSDNGPATAQFGYRPMVEIEDGIPEFVEWFRGQA